ncbi:hypothetical protein Pla123a_21760 [Posidoniimonas polymericola]|uniref:Uncharacterized protein n=1 Tax=Posidoniimonas polymericola TaxID=2528002 RepID=A0A5C5YRJ6_9BACT|nr:hypothetical protein [Posidoniimonas polymericola]TWT77515.1 hypothetical protein Pla123a_21760 [Posidoniimonas polymericola]
MDTQTAAPPQVTLQALAATSTAPRSPRLAPAARPFSDFGRWVDDVTVARPGTLWRLGDWIARNRRPGQLRSEVWRACRAANPYCFKTYTVIALARRSFFLPAGEVVFEATENPTQIPQSPPQGVMLRHLEALDAHPEATFYYLEPVFASEPTMRLYPADELRAEAAGDQQDAFMLARNYGAFFRARAWAGEQQSRCGAALAAAAERAEDALLNFAAWLLPQPASLRRLEASYSVAVRQGQQAEAERLQRAIRRVRWHMTFDPILCFELPGEPGRLRFEAHWYVGTDNKTYVHY